MKNGELTHGSLFSGIAGFDLAFQRAGFRPLWQVEIEPYCQAVLANHFPEAKRYSDIREFRKYELETPTVITAGVPCQPASVAGKRGGKGDPRWLWAETFEVIRLLKPTWAILENVRGLLSLEQETVFESLCLDLEAQGYEVQAFIVPACAFDAPHRRERVWIVGHAESRSVGREQEREDGMGKETSRERATHHHQLNGSGQDVADAEGSTKRTRLRQSEPGGKRRGRSGDRGGKEGWWLPEPDVGRVAHGVPSRVDRLKALGNAIVPQIAEWIAWNIRKVEESS